MARKFKKSKDEIKIEYPSVYGSHASMIDEEMTAKLKDNSLAILKDERGDYVTERKRLDNNMADTNRHCLEETRKKDLTEALT